MTFRTTAFRFAVIGCALALTACQLPSPIPSGYVHHSKLYKSPPARAPEDIGIPWTPATNEEAAAHWRTAAGDLADRIAPNLSEGKAHIVPAKPDDPLSAIFENYLREALQARGVALQTTRAATWPDLTFDTALVSDNPKRAQWMLDRRQKPTAAHERVNQMTPPPTIPVAPVVTLESTNSNAPIDLPPQSLTAPPQPPKPAAPPVAEMGSGPDRVAIRVDGFDRGRPHESWSGIYTVPGIDRYRAPAPTPSVLTPVVGERPTGGTMPPMGVNR